MASFENRVDRVFGSLGAPSWRLSDKQVERRQWSSCARERNDLRDNLVPSASSDFRHRHRATQTSLDEEENGDDEEGAEAEDGGGDSGAGDRMDVEGSIESLDEEEGRQMRRMVGLDCTLDFEDEEDEFDKTAIGREGNTERMYMREVKGSVKKIDTSHSLPLSLYDLKRIPRDPRANHMAAKARLEEDAREGAATSSAVVHNDSTSECKSLEPVHEKLLATNGTALTSNEEEEVNKLTSGIKRSSELTEDSGALPSALAGSKSNGKEKPIKRVRFALDTSEQVDGTGKMLQSEPVQLRVKSLHTSQVPDYVRNPSKYTHYTLDWSNDDDDLTNLKAFKSCAAIVRTKLEGNKDDIEIGPPPRIEFVPRENKVSAVDRKSNLDFSCSTCIAMHESYQVSDSKNLGVLTDGVNSETEEATAASNISLEGKLVKAPKNYRSKKGVIEAEEMDMEV